MEHHGFVRITKGIAFCEVSDSSSSSEQLPPRNYPGVANDDYEKRRSDSPRDFVAAILEQMGDRIKREIVQLQKVFAGSKPKARP